MISPSIKICGCTQIQNTLDVCNFPQVCAIGLNFYQPSKRSVSTKQAQNISQAIRKYFPDIKIVGLFVNHALEAITEILEQVDLDIIQFHGDESREILNKFSDKYEIWRSIPLGTIADLEILRNKPSIIDRWLIDAKVPGKFGGTGIRIDKDLVRKALQIDPTLILAGGITPRNIQDTIVDIPLTIIDIASGVESEAGMKDIEKIKALIEMI